MWNLFQSADVMLNVLWAALAVSTVLQWLLAGRSGERKREVVAVLFILVLLFPVISTADDIVRHAILYEPAASQLSLNGVAESKQFVSVGLLSVVTESNVTLPRLTATGEKLEVETPTLRTVLLKLSSGIHSPPQF